MANYWGFREPGCPLCRVAREAEQRYLRWFLLENYYTVHTLLRLTRSRFCCQHAAQLLTGWNDQLSSTFRFLAEAELLLLRQFRHKLRQEGRGILRRWKHRSLPKAAQIDGQPEDCPACQSGSIATIAEVGQLLKHLATEEERTIYQSHEGLCRPHLWLVLSRAPKETADWLVTETERRLEVLLQQFDLFFHRLDYRFHDEPKGEEQGAWRRALQFFWSAAALSGAGIMSFSVNNRNMDR